MKKGLIESETVRIIILVVAMVVIIGVIVLARDQMVVGIKSIFS